MSVVCRAAVRINNDGFLIRKVLCESGLDRLDNMSYRVGIVKARDADKDISLSYFFEPLFYFIS